MMAGLRTGELPPAADGRIRSTHRMSSGDAATASVSEDASAVAGAGGDATTLKDVSKKDRLQRMDQRRMR